MSRGILVTSLHHLAKDVVGPAVVETGFVCDTSLLQPYQKLQTVVIFLTLFAATEVQYPFACLLKCLVFPNPSGSN